MARDDRISRRCTYILTSDMLSGSHPDRETAKDKNPPTESPRTKFTEYRVFCRWSFLLITWCQYMAKVIRPHPDLETDNSPPRVKAPVGQKAKGFCLGGCYAVHLHTSSLRHAAAVCMPDRFWSRLFWPRRRWLVVVNFIVVRRRRRLLLRRGSGRRAASERVMPPSRPRFRSPAVAAVARWRRLASEIVHQRLLCRLCVERGGTDRMRRLVIPNSKRTQGPPPRNTG